MFHNELIANLPLSLSVKKIFENRSTFGEFTNKSIVACFFLTHIVLLIVKHITHQPTFNIFGCIVQTFVC